MKKRKPLQLKRIASPKEAFFDLKHIRRLKAAIAKYGFREFGPNSTKMGPRPVVADDRSGDWGAHKDEEEMYISVRPNSTRKPEHGELSWKVRGSRPRNVERTKAILAFLQEIHGRKNLCFSVCVVEGFLSHYPIPPYKWPNGGSRRTRGIHLVDPVSLGYKKGRVAPISGSPGVTEAPEGSPFIDFGIVSPEVYVGWMYQAGVTVRRGLIELFKRRRILSLGDRIVAVNELGSYYWECAATRREIKRLEKSVERSRDYFKTDEHVKMLMPLLADIAH